MGATYAGKHVVVAGDLMVDEFLRGRVDRISPEAPVPVLEFDSHTFVLGGAANVAHNVVSLGGEATVVGVIGDDVAGEHLMEALAAAGLRRESGEGIVVAPGRRTTLKTRVVAHTQHVVRIDREERTPFPDEDLAVSNNVEAALSNGGSALLISDYGKGAITAAIAQRAITAARSLELPIVVDTKHHNVKPFSGATVMTPNVREVEELSRVKITGDEALSQGARKLIDDLGLEALLVTRAEEGMSLFSRDGGRTDIPAMAIEVHDITGAGDTVAAALALALAGGSGLETSARFANLAAAVVVRKIGTATVTVDEIAAFADSHD